MNNFIYSLLLILFFYPKDGHGQYTFSGLLKNDQEPVSFATVQLKNSSTGTLSKEDGSFTLNNLAAGNYELIISAIGYEKTIVAVQIPNQTTQTIHVKQSESSIEQVVVTGTMVEASKLDSPVPVEVYTKQFFKANPTPSVFEAIGNVNGVRPQLNCNVCNTGDIHINGLEGPYTMVLIDGMPIVSGLSTVYGLTGIPQSLIERVEVVKGPASTLYGSEAVGGLINIITKKTDQAANVSADVFATDWQEINTDFGFKSNIGKKITALTGINYFNYKKPIDKNGDGFTDLTLQDRISVFQKLNINRKRDKELSLAGRYVYEDRWGGELNWENKYRSGDDVYGESIYTSRWETIGRYDLPTKENLSFSLSANGHQQNSFYGTTPFHAQQIIGFGQISYTKQMKNHSLLLGGVYRYTFYDDNTPVTSEEESTTHLPGAFLQDEIKINAKNKLLLGLRYDYNSLHGGIITPRLNYQWKSNEKNETIRVSAGNGYRVANVFTEDHAALTGARKVVFQGNLNPETSWNGNINYVKKFYQTRSFIGIDASAWYTHFSNRVVPDYETNQNQIIYKNLDGFSVSKGISTNVDVEWDNGLRLLTGATLMDVSVTENNIKKRQLLTESFQGVWNANYKFVKPNLTLHYTGSVYGPMRLPLLNETDNRAQYSPWFSIQNIQLTKKIKTIEIYSGVKNIFNYTPPRNSIARPFDPFNKQVSFDNNDNAIATPNNPNALTFDPSYVYTSNQGIRGFLGFRFQLHD